MLLPSITMSFIKGFLLLVLIVHYTMFDENYNICFAIPLTSQSV